MLANWKFIACIPTLMCTYFITAYEQKALWVLVPVSDSPRTILVAPLLAAHPSTLISPFTRLKKEMSASSFCFWHYNLTIPKCEALSCATGLLWIISVVILNWAASNDRDKHADGWYWDPRSMAVKSGRGISKNSKHCSEISLCCNGIHSTY